MKVIGITGGVGCGKSAILDGLSSRYRCFILKADDAAKELETKGHDCYDRLVELLGDDILDDEGNIINRNMSAKIFANPKLLQAVNDIVHPAVREYILARIEEQKIEGINDYFFLEAALLIECGYKAVVDEMWYIFATEEVRYQRLKDSRGYSDEKIKAIMSSQLTDNEYREASDFVVDNSNSLDEAMKMIEIRLSNGD